MVQSITASDWILPEINFSDELCIAEKDVYAVSEAGISFHGGFINFRECAYYYKHLNGGSGVCVGETNIDSGSPSFIFYTLPKPTSIHFTPRGRIKELFSKAPLQQRFFNFQKQINATGYRTFDLS